jgi:hypothetical protein
MIASFRPFTKSASHTTHILFALSLAWVSTCGWSQTQLGTVFGTVTDPTGAVITGAQVTVSSVSTGLKRDALTDLRGQYYVAGLPTGKYSVRIDKEGFQTEVREDVAISAAAIAINLTLQVGSVPQQVTASADVPAIDITTSTVSGAISELSLSELPLNDRDLFKAAVLEPGVVQTPSAAPSLLSNGKTAARTAAESSRPSLKSGSNQFHGSLFELHRDARLDAKNYFDLASRPIPQFVRNQFGASIEGPLVHDRTFFFVSYEGFREVRASTAIATVPDELAHQGLLPSASDPGACSSATPNGCIPIGVDPRAQPFLALLPPSNGADNRDGTGDLITADKGTTNEQHGMARVDHNFSNTHSFFGRYIIDDGSSLVPYFGSPPGTYVPGFPVSHQARNQYFTLQDRKSLSASLFNELRFGINRTTASTSIVDTHPGLSISRLPGRPFGMIDVAGMSLIGNSPEIPVGDFFDGISNSGPSVPDDRPSDPKLRR